MTVALGSMILDADDFVEIVICIHGPSPSEDAAIFEETPVFLDGCYVILRITSGAVPGVDVSLDPSVDVHMAGGTIEDRFTANDTDDSRNVSGKNVTEDEGGLEPSGGIGTPVKDGGIPHDSIDDGDRTNAEGIDLEANLRLVDGDPLEIPLPVPHHLDTGVRTVDGDVSDGELLVSDVESDVSTVNDEVTHKTTTEDPI